MQRIFRLRSYCLAGLVALGLTSNIVCAATPSPRALDCAADQLQGSYPFFTATTVTVGPGTVVAIPDPLLATSPAIIAGRGTIVFDDGGTVLLTATHDHHGAALAPMTYQGNYILDPQCVVTVDFANGLHFTGRIVGDTAQQWFASTTPGFVVVATP